MTINEQLAVELPVEQLLNEYLMSSGAAAWRAALRAEIIRRIGAAAASPQAPAPPAHPPNALEWLKKFLGVYQHGDVGDAVIFVVTENDGAFLVDAAGKRWRLSEVLEQYRISTSGASPAGLERKDWDADKDWIDARTPEKTAQLYRTVEDALQSGKCPETWPEIWRTYIEPFLSRSLEGRGGERERWQAQMQSEVTAAHKRAEAAERELGALRRELQQFRMILDLVATDELFVQPAEGEGWVFWVNVNDMFYPASDGEGIDISEIPAVWQAWKDKGWPGVVRWVQEKRGGLKLRKSREERILTIESLQSRAAQLEAALRQYAVHADGCSALKGNFPSMKWPEHPRCDCGLREAALVAPVAQESTE
jgi:hypothetical protein